MTHVCGENWFTAKFSFHISNNLEVWLNQVFFAQFQIYIFQLLFI